LLKNVVIVETHVGLNIGLANGDNSKGDINVKNSLIIGEHVDSRDCTENY